MTIFYQPETSNFRTLFTWNGSIFPLVFKDNHDVYFFWFVHIVFYVFRCLEEAEIMPNVLSALGKGDDISARLQLPGLMIVFLAVFYNQHCYSRYQTYITKSFKIAREILQWTHELAAYQGAGTPDVQNAARCLQAAHHLAYYQVGHKMHYGTLLERQLLTDAEMSLIKEYDGDEYSLPLVWCFEIIQNRMVKNKKHPMAFKGLRDKLYDIEDMLGQIFEVEDVPIPFAYYHMLNASCFFYLIIFSAGTAYMNFGWVTGEIFMNLCTDSDLKQKHTQKCFSCHSLLAFENPRVR